MIKEPLDPVYGVVYKITNLVNGSFYIGQTKMPMHRRVRKHLSDARRGFDTIFCRAIRKHGEAAFAAEVVAFCRSREELNELETKLIAELRPRYNSCAGGGGLGSPTDEVRQKVSLAMKERTFSDEHRRRISEGLRGRVVSKETVQKIQAALQPRYEKMRLDRLRKYGTLKRVKRLEPGFRPYEGPNAEYFRSIGARTTSEKISAMARLRYATGARRKLVGLDSPHYGKELSEARKLKLSELFSGERNPYYGKKHSEETRAKMVAAHAARATLTCPKCGKEGNVGNMKRWHFDNCREGR